MNTYLLELLLCDEVVIFTRFLFIALWWPRCITDLFLEDALILFEDLLDEGILTNTWWSYKDEGLSSQWCRIEWVEVFFAVNIYIILIKYSKIRIDLWNVTYRFVEQYTAKKIVKNFSNFWMLMNICFMALNEFVFSDGEISEDLVIKVNFIKIHSISWVLGIHILCFFKNQIIINKLF